MYISLEVLRRSNALKLYLCFTVLTSEHYDNLNMATHTDSDIPEPDNTALIQMCQRAPLIAGSSFGNRIVRLSDTLVAKYGMGVWREEARNQEYAYAHVDKSILYVPRVFRYFDDISQGSRVGYLVMEYVPGTPLDSVDADSDAMMAVTRAVKHLSRIPAPKSHVPGPVGQGASRGYL
ncbi:unnamed protein product [Periconia digitata]|uniref:Aminoglycoside phosphotransferase domain-containing protein n=1 Tax=Periconia digitata TaxID=1303443 RepID=A0A9W4UQM3_9PLEO|nr:unnamed protein product [Periconia digitata]